MNHRDDFTHMALGLVSVQSFPAIVGIADHMLKASEVSLIGYEKIGAGNCTAVVRGTVANVRLAVAEGAEWAEKFFGQTASTLVVPRPMPNLDAVLPIGNRLAQLVAAHGRSKLSNLAIGLLETKGFPAMVGAADAMLKSSEVVLGGYETIGSGLCTAIIRGSLSNVVIAIEAGMAEAERIGELHAVMVVQRPLEDLEQTLPTAKCWVEELQPIQLPIAIKETDRELVPLPDRVQTSRVLAIPDSPASTEVEVISHPQERSPELAPVPTPFPTEDNRLAEAEGSADANPDSGPKLKRQRLG
jgi:carbon dioxide concentrating mechanism protein CcmO